MANLATALAGKLQVAGWGASEDLRDLLALDRTPRAASTDERRRAVSELLREMNTNLPLVTVVAPQDELQVAASGAKKIEPIYKTPYFAEKLSTDVKPSPIKFPPVNPYIPDTDPRPRYAKKSKPTLRDFGPPTLVQDDGFGKLWFKPDLVFGVPRAAVLVLLRTEATGSKSAADAIHARIWTRLATDALRDADYQREFDSYDASLAGLEWTLGAGPRGMQLSFGGYDAKLPELAEAVS